MVEYMEKHDSLAKNSLQSAANGRSKEKQLWDKLTELLNSNRPPMKPTKGWQKVWTDYKYNAKRKLTQRMKSMTKKGGGPYDAISLNHMEERIVAAAKISEHISGVPGTTSYGCHTDGPSCSTAAPQADDTFVSEYLSQISSADNSSSDDEGKTSSKTESPKINIREEVEIDEVQQAAKRKRYSDRKVKIIEKEIEKQEKFQSEVLRLFEESNEIAKRKLQLKETQIATEVQYKKMKIQVLELDLEKLKCEIALLKRKMN